MSSHVHASLMYHFAWDDLCDWYLELSKEAFASGNAEGTKRVLGLCSRSIIPFDAPSNAIYYRTDVDHTYWGESLVVARMASRQTPAHVDKKAESLIAQLQEIITEVRRFRNDQGIKTITEDSWSNCCNWRYREVRISGCLCCPNGAWRHHAKCQV